MEQQMNYLRFKVLAGAGGTHASGVLAVTLIVS